MTDGSTRRPDETMEQPRRPAAPGRRLERCPECNNATLAEDAWGERDPETGTLYAEPRLYCTNCSWVQAR